jgi:superoxide dismutase, Fe-Mn family
MAFTLPDLPYAFNALEPHIDAKTMEIHHDKHHGTYVAKLNAALDKFPEFQSKKIEDILKNVDSVPQESRGAVKNHGGGHFNHSLFWKLLSPDGGKPAGSILTSIEKGFGSFDTFKEQFSNSAANHFGSGWTWLCLDGSKKLLITATPNQDTPLAQNLKPILGLDVWEHAYYLKYQNRRPEYIAAFWNIINWKQAAENLEKAME